MQMKQRIAYLDGHRGLAILLVVGYHAYSRWPGLVAYGGRYADIALFKYGFIGVNLFFLVSGFVILMTLEKCRGFNEFIFRRWIRLFPAMLICSLLIFATAGYFYERPMGTASWSSLLPGLTFVEPSWWRLAIGYPRDILEKDFWTLYVEFKFYVFAAALYFWKGRNWLLAALSCVYCLSLIAGVMHESTTMEFFRRADLLVQVVSFEYFGWFGAGAAFYVYSKTRELKWCVFALGLSLLSTLPIRGIDWQGTMAGVIVAALFAASISAPLLQRILTLRVLQFFGFISYPLYLIHENAMISIIVKLGRIKLAVPDFLLPVVATFLLSVAAYLIAGYLEPYTRRLILAAGKLGVRTAQRVIHAATA